MNQMMDPIVAEFSQEAKTTERVLAKVPNDKLGWKPHSTSLSLGQLAMHIATVPGGFAQALKEDVHELRPDAFTFAAPKSASEIQGAFQKSTQEAQTFLSGLSDSQARANWTMKSGGKQIMTMPRVNVIRMVMMNHIYHHRGQLAVYLRMLDVPVPSIYGPSGDENPFA